MNRNLKQGFTLIELLLYVALMGAVLLAISVTLRTVLEARVQNQTVAEVEQTGIQVMQIITQTIRNAEDITSPTAGTSASGAVIDVENVAKDPTTFDLSGNTLQITEGSNPAVALTGSRTVVSNLTFKNLSYAGTKGTIKIEFTLSHINEGDMNEYDYSKIFYGSATLRDNQL